MRNLPWMRLEAASGFSHGRVTLRLGRTWADLEAAESQHDLGGDETWNIKYIQLVSDGTLEIRHHNRNRVLDSPAILGSMSCARVRYPGNKYTTALREGVPVDMWYAPPVEVELVLSDPVEDRDRRAFVWQAEVSGVRVEHPSTGFSDRWMR